MAFFSSNRQTRRSKSKVNRGDGKANIHELMHRAESALSQRHFDEASKLYRQVTAQRPKHIQARIGLARRLAEQGDFAGTRRALEKIVCEHHFKQEVLCQVGEMCLSYRLDESAARYFKQVVAHDSDHSQACLGLSRLREHQNQFEEAWAWVKRAARDGNNNANVHIQAALLERRLGCGEESIKRLSSLLKRSDLEIRDRIAACYELGRALDDASRYNQAMNTWLQAKALQRKLPEFHLATRIAAQEHLRFERLAHELQPDRMQVWLSEAPTTDPMPLAFLLGHPRSGTTLLEQILDAHPLITSGQELHAFHDHVRSRFHKEGNRLGAVTYTQAIDQLKPQHRTDYRRTYRAAMAKSIGDSENDRFLIDKNPSLTPFLPLIARVFPEAKWIIALRDPRDVCLSCFTQNLGLNGNSVNYFSLEQTAKWCTTTMGVWTKIRDAADPLKWTEIRYEDVVNDMEGQVKRVLNLLKLPWDPNVLNYRKDLKIKTVLSPTYADVSKPIYRSSISRWRHYSTYFKKTDDILSPVIQSLGYQD